jgi:hypothetical protein
VVAHPFRDAVWVGGLAAPRPHALPGRASASRTASSSTEALARHGHRMLLRESITEFGDCRFSEFGYDVRLWFVDVANL